MAQALSEVHAAGVCLLDLSVHSVWISDTGSVTFLDFSMAHEFVPGMTSHVMFVWASCNIIKMLQDLLSKRSA